MTAAAAQFLSDFELLSPDEQLLVRQRVISLTEGIQSKALENLIGASEGKELLSKLLTDRARERERG